MLLSRIEAVDDASFADLALAVFRYQATYNPLYSQFLELLRVDPHQIVAPEAIPFLPIALCKTHLIQTGQWTPERIFSSSGTTGAATSRHALRDPDFYRRNARRGFAATYGPVSNYAVLALLPAYLEREGSSLVFMAQDFIEQSACPDSGFFLHDTQALLAALDRCLAAGWPTLLLGVSFALLDLAENHPLPLPGVVVMETGGMKGRRRELTRTELHQLLQEAFGLPSIHAEYGMTELLSQAYSTGGGWFEPAPTLRAYCREPTDPLSIQPFGRAGALNLIDLANLDSISFLATDDLGRVQPDGRFEVLGRLDASDIRGCNLMVE